MHNAQPLDNMVLFVTLAQTLNFGEAAKRLALSSSTLTRRLQALESQAGIKLINRTTRSVELTEAGRMYYEASAPVVEQAQIAQDALMHYREAPQGLLRIAMPVDFGQVYIAPILTQFASQYPNIRFELDLSPKNLDLQQSGIDVAFRIGSLSDSSMVAYSLGQIEIGLFAAPRYIDIKGMPLHPSELVDHERITTIGRANWHLSDRSQGAHLEHLHHAERQDKPNLSVNQISEDEKSTEHDHDYVIKGHGQFAMNNIGMQQSLALEGMGIAALPLKMAKPWVCQERLIPVLAHWRLPSLPVSMLTTSRLLPVRTRRFIAFAQEQFGSLSDASDGAA